MSSSNKTLIDNLLSQLSELTQSFIKDLEIQDSDHVEQFVQERELLVQQLHEVLDVEEMSDMQKEALKKVLAYDKIIEQRMSSLKNEAQEWLLQRNTAKTQRTVYESKYASESYLMDKRK
ncbi:hypothetical protein MKX68_14230 [Paenibacillus sp. FSL M8-0212]|uniref:hypothetical protein n=1 Tax=Paenibacillus sp. FSL M8-0212 TaxID=2921618 RepID=UPI0030F4D4AD